MFSGKPMYYNLEVIQEGLGECVPQDKNPSAQWDGKTMFD